MPSSPTEQHIESQADTGPPGIYVLAGPNGAGKSSVGGAVIEASGGRHFDPDQVAVALMRRDSTFTLGDANSEAWHQMVRLLERAIAENRTFAFETTLSGNTITGRLQDAAMNGVSVHVWYVALASADLHVERVKQRVAAGGQDIPEAVVRSRYDTSRLHLIDLLAVLAEVFVYDNTEEKLLDVAEPRLLLHMVGGRVVAACDLADVPTWAKPILAEAMRLDPEFF
jgi:predicted ABC-type ATPase